MFGNEMLPDVNGPVTSLLWTLNRGVRISQALGKLTSSLPKRVLEGRGCRFDDPSLSPGGRSGGRPLCLPHRTSPEGSRQRPTCPRTLGRTVQSPSPRRCQVGLESETDAEGAVAMPVPLAHSPSHGHATAPLTGGRAAHAPGLQLEGGWRGPTWWAAPELPGGEGRGHTLAFPGHIPSPPPCSHP